MPEPIELHVCCNDDAGNDTGRVWAIGLYEHDDPIDPLIELESKFDPTPELGSSATDGDTSCFETLTYHGGQIVIGGRVYQLASNQRGTHVGNIFWDCFWITESTARQIATDCLRSGNWSDSISSEGWWWDDKEGDWQDA